MSIYYFINTAISNDLLNEILKTGLICVGSKGCGKSNSVKVITRELLIRGLADVKVFDLALNWLFDFEQLTYQLIEEDTTIINANNCIYDFTLINNQNEVNYTMQRLMKTDYHNKAKMKLICDGAIYNYLVYIVEEAQNIIGSSCMHAVSGLKRFQHLVISVSLTFSLDKGYATSAPKQLKGATVIYWER